MTLPPIGRKQVDIPVTVVTAYIFGHQYHAMDTSVLLNPMGMMKAMKAVDHIKAPTCRCN